MNKLRHSLWLYRRLNVLNDYKISLIMCFLTNELKLHQRFAVKIFSFYLVIIFFRNINIIILTRPWFQRGELKINIKKAIAYTESPFLKSALILFILTHLWVFIIITHPLSLSARSEWIIEMHVLFAIDYIHNLLKAFCSDVGRPPKTFESETLWACSQPNKDNRLLCRMQVYE